MFHDEQIQVFFLNWRCYWFKSVEAVSVIVMKLLKPAIYNKVHAWSNNSQEDINFLLPVFLGGHNIVMWEDGGDYRSFGWVCNEIQPI